jgi:hypothetical protein
MIELRDNKMQKSLEEPNPKRCCSTWFCRIGRLLAREINTQNGKGIVDRAIVNP